MAPSYEGTPEGISKALADARRPYVLAQKANLARIEELIGDYERLHDLNESGGNVEGARYAAGAVEGLRRAVRVLEGRG
jgi:hypothetical protein